MTAQDRRTARLLADSRPLAAAQARPRLLYSKSKENSSGNEEGCKKGLTVRPGHGMITTPIEVFFYARKGWPRKGRQLI